jgi:hypothetical protein
MDKLSASEALFGFMGWLTSLETPVTFSSHHEAGIAAQLVDEFCKANNLAEPREFWHLNLHHPASRPTPRAVDKSGAGSSPQDLPSN